MARYTNGIWFFHVYVCFAVYTQHFLVLNKKRPISHIIIGIMTSPDVHMSCINALGQAWRLLKPSKLRFLGFNSLQAYPRALIHDICPLVRSLFLKSHSTKYQPKYESCDTDPFRISWKLVGLMIYIRYENAENFSCLHAFYTELCRPQAAPPIEKKMQKINFINLTC